MSTTPGLALRLIWLTLSPRLALNVAGRAAWREGATAVVTECVVVLPPATISAIAPPATAPPTTGRMRLARLMFRVLLRISQRSFEEASHQGPMRNPSELDESDVRAALAH